MYLWRNKLKILHLWGVLCISSCHNSGLVMGPAFALGLRSAWATQQNSWSKFNKPDLHTQWQNSGTRFLPSEHNAMAQNQMWSRLPSSINPLWLTGLRKVKVSGFLCVVWGVWGDYSSISTNGCIQNKRHSESWKNKGGKLQRGKMKALSQRQQVTKRQRGTMGFWHGRKCVRAMFAQWTNCVQKQVYLCPLSVSLAPLRP